MPSHLPLCIHVVTCKCMLHMSNAWMYYFVSFGIIIFQQAKASCFFAIFNTALFTVGHISIRYWKCMPFAYP